MEDLRLAALDAAIAEGAKGDVRRKVKDGGEREMRQLRDRAQRELDRLDDAHRLFATITTSRRSNKLFVADKRICSICSLMDESFSIKRSRCGT